MYTILLTESNELVATVRERIMQRSKLVDSFQVLTDPTYKGVDMSDFTVMMEYLTPVSHEYKSEILVKDDELYLEKLRYTVPFDTCLTREAGEIEVQLTFVKVGMDANGKSVQYVRKTSPTTITIVPISAWSDIIADSALTAIDQRLIQVDAMLNAVNDMTQTIYDTKADNISYNAEGQYIQLTSNGNPIGNKIQLSITPDEPDGVCVKYVTISENGNLVVTYSDGSTEEIGKVTCDAGIYIPDVSKDGILTMTLSKDVGDPSYSWDIDLSNNWNEIDGVEAETTYVWHEL